ncbi:hypothetical protein PC119_g16552 [Phytophthora cactorum]|nr:hypothetical protein PC119_g16552 [Phytophthora cactorum]
MRTGCDATSVFQRQRRDRYQHVAERRRSVPHRIGAM